MDSSNFFLPQALPQVPLKRPKVSQLMPGNLISEQHIPRPCECTQLVFLDAQRPRRKHLHLTYPCLLEISQKVPNGPWHNGKAMEQCIKNSMTSLSTTMNHATAQ